MWYQDASVIGLGVWRRDVGDLSLTVETVPPPAGERLPTFRWRVVCLDPLRQIAVADGGTCYSAMQSAEAWTLDHYPTTSEREGWRNG